MTCQQLANESVERFVKNFGDSHDIVVMVMDRTGGLAMCSSTGEQAIVEGVAKGAANSLMQTGIIKARDWLARTMRG